MLMFFATRQALRQKGSKMEDKKNLTTQDENEKPEEAENPAAAPDNETKTEAEKPEADKPAEEDKPAETGKPGKKTRRLPLPLKILLVVFAFVAVAVGLVVGYVNGKLSLIRYDDGTVDTVGTIDAEEDQDLDGTGLEQGGGEMEMPEGSPFADDDVLNVLLISTDERTEAVNDADAFTNLGELDGTEDTTEFSEDARADSLILASLNITDDTIKLVSVERATGVPILLDGYEDQYDWITHTFRYGGAKLTMDTVEECFNVQVDHYVRFNFNSFVQIVDAVGGIDIELTELEAAALNWEVPSNSMLIVGKVHAGLNHMDGYTALQYARLRSIDSDWQRIERQRTVIQAVLDQIKSASVAELDNLLNTVLPLVQTNFTRTEIAALLVQLPGFLGVQTEQMSLPVEGTYGVRTGMDDRTMYDPDWPLNAEILQDFLYEGMSAEEAIAAHVEASEDAPEATAAPAVADAPGGYLGAYTQVLDADPYAETLDTEAFGETAYRVFLAGGRADQAETWQQAAALLRSLHENQGVNAVLLPCGPAAALALNEELAQGTPPAALADNAASEEEAAFWEWLAAYNAEQSESGKLRFVGVGAEEDAALALRGLRGLLADTLPAIDPDTLTSAAARTVWQQLQDDATYEDADTAAHALNTLRALAGQADENGMQSDLYQFFSGNLGRARTLLSAMGETGEGAAGAAARFTAAWDLYSSENFFALVPQADALPGDGSTLADALAGESSPVAGQVCHILIGYLDPETQADAPALAGLDDLSALYQEAAAARQEALDAEAAALAEENGEDWATPAPTEEPESEEAGEPALFLALDADGSPYPDTGADKLLLIPQSGDITAMDGGEGEAEAEQTPAPEQAG